MNHDKSALKRLSKQMSWILRHQADRLGLDIDPEGFVPLQSLLALIRETSPDASEDMIHAVVDLIEPQKQRFSIVDGYIRANYGHSIDSPIIYPAEKPPAILYHGTSEETKARILKEGLRAMQRQFVHLTVDTSLANQIGGRHGKPCILVVNAGSAHDEGTVFHNANRGFWLCASIPSKYLSASFPLVK